MGFEASWLDLREPADHAARDAGLLQEAVKAAGDAPVIVDLGAGTGSTLRAFGALASSAQWRLVDGDEKLLSLAAERHEHVSTHCLNLQDLDQLPLENANLVTASALFDLMPRDWCERLADLLAENRIGFYAALNYDGRMLWEPALMEDPLVTKSFNQHQRMDKGMGNAMGPDAGPALSEIFEARGYRVTTAQSPWKLGPADAELQRQLVDGIAKAAIETGSIFAENWRYARLAACSSCDCSVGHVDVLAIPG